MYNCMICFHCLGVTGVFVSAFYVLCPLLSLKYLEYLECVALLILTCPRPGLNFFVGSIRTQVFLLTFSTQ